MSVNKRDILHAPLGGLAREEGRRSRDRLCAEAGDDPAVDASFFVLLFVLRHLNLPPARPLEWVPAIFAPVHRQFKVPGRRLRRRQASLRALMGLSIQIYTKYYRKLGKEIAEMK
jgi:hypothetical protein